MRARTFTFDPVKLICGVGAILAALAGNYELGISLAALPHLFGLTFGRKRY